MVQITLGELEKVAVLGAGAFGQVTLVKRLGQYYALKVLSKAHIVHNGLQARSCRGPHVKPYTLDSRTYAAAKP